MALNTHYIHERTIVQPSHSKEKKIQKKILRKKIKKKKKIEKKFLVQV